MLTILKAGFRSDPLGTSLALFAGSAMALLFAVLFWFAGAYCQ